MDVYTQGRATALGAVSIIRYSYCSKYPGIWSYWRGLGFLITMVTRLRLAIKSYAIVKKKKGKGRGEKHFCFILSFWEMPLAHIVVLGRHINAFRQRQDSASHWWHRPAATLVGWGRPCRGRVEFRVAAGALEAGGEEVDRLLQAIAAGRAGRLQRLELDLSQTLETLWTT